MVARVFLWVAAAMLIPLLMGFFSPLTPLADSMAHFRLHLSVAVAVVGLLMIYFNGYRRALHVLAFAVLGLWGSGFYLGNTVKNSENGELRLLQLNLQFRNHQYQQVLDVVGRHDPDLITFQEVRPHHRRLLAALAAAYPYQVNCPFKSVGGVAVLSRLPPPSPESANRGCVRGQGLAWLRVGVAGKALSVASLHLHWPYPFGQSSQIDRLRQPLLSIPRPVLLAGDFNAAPWSYAVTRIAQYSGTRIASGLHFSFDLWPGGPPLFVLPIDHVLLPDGMMVSSIHVGPQAGSDHRSLLASFSFK